MWKIKLTLENRKNLFPKIVHESNGHLEIFSCPQIKENSGQYLLLRTGIF